MYFEIKVCVIVLFSIDCLERACSSSQEGKKRLASTEGDVQQQVNSTYYEGYGYIAVGPIQDD